MRLLLLFALALCCATCLFIACKKDTTKELPASDNTVSPQVLAQIKDLGFSTTAVTKWKVGYVVEKDIFLSEEDLTNPMTGAALRIIKDEQYRTANTILVNTAPRLITIRVTQLGAAYVRATDTVIARFNALGLNLQFSRVTTSSADINIYGFSQWPVVNWTLSGMPSASGNPYPSIGLNYHSAAFGLNPMVNYIACYIQHELGHCIGFRHTDYFNRALSCGGPPDNEGSAGIGAIWIPGTTTSGDYFSFMSACPAQNCGFSSNDIIALNYLY